MPSIDPSQALMLLGVGMVAGFINVLAGGGSLLTMPLMIFLGLPETVANGTARVAILVQNASAIVRYRRAGRVDLDLAAALVPAALLGAILGALAATWIGDPGFRHVLGAVMAASALLIVGMPRRVLDRVGGGQRRHERWRVWPTLFVIGFYGGLVQAGVGYVILLGLTWVLGIGLVEANIMKVVLVFAYTPLAIAIFGSQGKIAWVHAVVLACGQALGAWLAAGLALERGAAAIRALLAVAVALMALELLGAFDPLLAGR